MDSLRIGTRRSPLALTQAYETRDRIKTHFPDLPIDIIEISTTGDHVLDKRLSTIGGKGLFTKEIDQALLENQCDIGVHSMKDLETNIHEATEICAVLPREDVRDALISSQAHTLDTLDKGAVIGTASLRRQAQILAQRPDLEVISFRGNVQTRLKKLEAGNASATFLAMAGLKRLGIKDSRIHPLAPEDFLPAVAQGAIAITRRKEDTKTADRVDFLNHAESAFRTQIERAFLATLEGSCQTPIAGLALIEENNVWFRGLTARPDGSGLMRVENRGPKENAVTQAIEAAETLLPRMDASYRP